MKEYEYYEGKSSIQNGKLEKKRKIWAKGSGRLKTTTKAFATRAKKHRYYRENIFSSFPLSKSVFDCCFLSKVIIRNEIISLSHF